MKEETLAGKGKQYIVVPQTNPNMAAHLRVGIRLGFMILGLGRNNSTTGAERESNCRKMMTKNNNRGASGQHARDALALDYFEGNIIEYALKETVVLKSRQHMSRHISWHART